MKQVKDLEIAMNMEASLVREMRFGMNQIQSQLANLTIQLQDIKKGWEFCDEVWCTRWPKEGHHEDQFLYFREYVQEGAPNH